MALLGKAGMTEIPNESVVLNSIQSNIGDKTGLYIFPVSVLGKAQRAKKRTRAMKKMQQRIAANPSGILMYHSPGRQFEFGKSLAIEFSIELFESILAVFLLTQTRIGSFCRASRLCPCSGSPGRDRNERFLLELVRLPGCLHSHLYAH
jgi:hypothetical protein